MLTSNIRQDTEECGSNQESRGLSMNDQKQNSKLGTAIPPSSLLLCRVDIFRRGRLQFQINLVLAECLVQLSDGGGRGTIELTKLILGKTFIFITETSALIEIGRLFHRSMSLRTLFRARE